MLRNSNKYHIPDTINRDLLFTNTKALKDVFQYFISGNSRSGDISKMGKSLTEIFTEKIATDLAMQTIDNMGKGFVSTSERFVMAGIGNDDIVLVDFGNVSGPTELLF